MWGALGVLGRRVERLCASGPQLERVVGRKLQILSVQLSSECLYCCTVGESVSVELTTCQVKKMNELFFNIVALIMFC